MNDKAVNLWAQWRHTFWRHLVEYSYRADESAMLKNNAAFLPLVVLLWAFLLFSFAVVCGPSRHVDSNSFVEVGSVTRPSTNVHSSSGLEEDSHVRSASQPFLLYEVETKRRGLKGKKKRKKERVYDEPAKISKLSVTSPPSTAPILQPTFYPVLGDHVGTASAYYRHATPSPSVPVSRDVTSASERHEDSSKVKYTKKKGKSEKGLSNKSKKGMSSESKKGMSSKSEKSSTNREKHQEPSASNTEKPTSVPSVVYPDLTQQPTVAPAKQPSSPPFPDLLDMPSLFLPPSDPSVIPRSPAPAAVNPVGFVPISPPRGKDRPTPPLIVLSPVQLPTPTTPSPTTMIQTLAPSKVGTVRVPPTNAPTTLSPSLVDSVVPSTLSPSLMDNFRNSTMFPTSSGTAASSNTAKFFGTSNSSEPTMSPFSNNATTSSPFNVTAAPSSQSSTATLSTLLPTTFETPLPTAPPTPDIDIRRVTIPRIYIAYSAPDTERQPTVQETIFVVQLTTLYFEEIFAERYSESEFTFELLEMRLITDQYDIGLPSEWFNIYLEFDTDAVFRVDNANVELPQVNAMLEQMVDAIDLTYTMDYVWQVPRESPYFRTQEAVAGTVVALRQGGDYSTQSTAKEQLVEPAMSIGNFTLSESVQALEDRFILPGSKLPAGLFALNDALDEEEGS